MASGYHDQPIPPSGVAHALFLHLFAPPTPSHPHHRPSSATQLVTARDDLLSIYDVRIQHHVDDGNDNGNGNATARLHLVRHHRLFGSVTALARVDTHDPHTDTRASLVLVAFKDAKLALLEWNSATANLDTVSIHTYERAPQLAQGSPPNFTHSLAVDAHSRCAALLLPQDAIAVLPFYQDINELDFFDIDTAATNGAPIDALPYSPSFVLPFRDVDPLIKNVRAFCFLPGFQKPTVAVLFEQPRTWTGRLTLTKDTCSLYIFTLDLAASMAAHADAAPPGGTDVDSGLQAVHPILTTTRFLPSDCLYVVPCPQKLGGVMVVSASALVHIDQSGRVVVTAINDWLPITSSAAQPESTCKLDGLTDLHSSQLAFTDTSEGILTLSDGTFCRFWCLMDGRSVGGMRIERISTPSQLVGEATRPVQAAPPSATALMPGDLPYLLSASMVGDSTLFRYAKVESLAESDEEVVATKVEDSGDNDDADMDLDEDLYGDTTQDGAAAATSSKAAKKETLELIETDRIAGYGVILDVATRQVPVVTEGEGSRARKQLVACTGHGIAAGLTYFEPDAAPKKRRRLDTRAADRVWRVSGPAVAREVALLCSAAEEDVSELVVVGKSKGDDETQELPGRTLAAGPLNGTSGRWARVTASGLSVHEQDGATVHTIETSQVAVLSASIDEGEYAILQLSDGSMNVYRYDAEIGNFTALVLPDGVSTKQGACVNIVRDRYRFLMPLKRAEGATAAAVADANTQSQSNGQKDSKKAPAYGQVGAEDDEIDYGDEDEDMGGVPTSSAQAISSAAPAAEAKGEAVAAAEGDAQGGAYLFIMDTDGVCELYSLPQLDLCWRNYGLPALADRLDLELEPAYRLPPEYTVEIASAKMCHLDDVLYLVVLTSTNLLLAYESNPHASGTGSDTLASLNPTNTLLSLGFNKILSLPLSASTSTSPNRRPTESRSSAFAGEETPTLLPFGARSAHHDSIAVLGGGKVTTAGSWLFKTRRGGVKLVDWEVGTGMGVEDVCWFGEGEGGGEGREVAVCGDGSIYLSLFPTSRCYDTPWSYQTYRTGRSYSKVVAHDETGCIVAASVNEQGFVLYDEEGEAVGDSEDDKTPTLSHRGALELFVDEDKDEPIHGWEFDANETVISLEIVTLDAPSVPGGRKKFVAAGTSVFYGEDRAAKGSAYIFEIIEVVTDSLDRTDRFRLKLLCRDDAKAPVTALADLNGFLISTAGQKLYVRALEKEEWLISIAFHELSFYVTRIRVLKNFLLLSDIRKSLSFLAFQEDPYKFILLAKDVGDQWACTADFLVYRERLSLVSSSAAGGGTGGREGVLRLFEYNPTSPASGSGGSGGQKLIVKTEWQSAASEAVKSLAVRGRWLSRYERRGAESLRSKILFAMSNGSLETLSAIDEPLARRLQMLQGQLVRSVRHFAALNPRGFRAVRNDLVSRPLIKGVVDGRLLALFPYLPRPKMVEAVSTLAGLFGGADEVNPSSDVPPSAEGEGDGEEEEEKRREREERRRREIEACRADCVLADLVRVRAGFEVV